LGAGFARLLAGAGANIVLGARRLDRLERLARELDAAGAQSLAVKLDVTDEASVVEAFDRAEARFGTVNSIVANAGMACAGRSTDTPLAGVRQVIDTILIGAYLVTREAARRLIASGSREREDGRIILIGSISAEQAHVGDAAYAASKAAIAHLAGC